ALEHCVEELPCAADEWFALAVLFHAGRFADHHPLSRAIAHAEYGLRARRVQWTEVAVTHGGLEFGPATPRAGGAQIGVRRRGDRFDPRRRLGPDARPVARQPDIDFERFEVGEKH